MFPMTKRQDALDYHANGRPGKIAVVPTKPLDNQRDLSLAYSPGVAEPCLEIERDPDDRLHLHREGKSRRASSPTAPPSSGSATSARSPASRSWRAKGISSSSSPTSTSSISRSAPRIPTTSSASASSSSPRSAGSTSRTSARPTAFYIEETLRKTLKIPVFHDDQHGTAIISGAALLNALEVVEKKIDDVRVVFSGAGAAAISTAEHYVRLGVRASTSSCAIAHGVIYEGRAERDAIRTRRASRRDRRRARIADALDGADVFVGLSVAGVVTGDMVEAMAPQPIIFALANPVPEILPEEVRAVRDDAIIATGRSDYPNQVNNVLGFPFIFRGALDVRATEINEEMKMAATRALALLAQGRRARQRRAALRPARTCASGAEYLIPFPFDPRVLLWVAPAVAWAAVASGAASEFIDLDEYRERLESRLGRARGVMRGLINRAASDPKRVVFPEGEEPKIIRAARICVEDGIAEPILLGNPRDDRAVRARLQHSTRRHRDRGSRDVAEP